MGSVLAALSAACAEVFEGFVRAMGSFPSKLGFPVPTTVNYGAFLFHLMGYWCPWTTNVHTAEESVCGES